MNPQADSTPHPGHRHVVTPPTPLQASGYPVGWAAPGEFPSVLLSNDNFHLCLLLDGPTIGLPDAAIHFFCRPTASFNAQS